MNEAGFRRFLKASGKKPHVIDGLVGEVGDFQAYLAGECQKDLETLTPDTFLAYARRFPADEIAKRVRGIMLYFKFTGQTELAALAADLREKQIASTRRVFRLGEFRGVDPAQIERLAAIGVVDVEQLLVAGKTPGQREQLAAQTGIPLAAILELVKLSDLSRLGALKQVRARLYYEAGIDTPDKAAQWEPEALHRFMAEYVAQTGFEGLAPLPKEVRNLVETARKIERMVEY